MATYKTAEIAVMIGIHPNTVRLYESLELIPQPERLSNGYRVFTEFHIEQCRLVQLAGAHTIFKTERGIRSTEYFYGCAPKLGNERIACR